jgi:hypothetical protein
VYVINESNLKGCPRVVLEIVDREVTAILDSGAEISVMSEEVYNNLVAGGLQPFHFPVTGGVLISAFGARSKRIRKQALIQFKIDDVCPEQVFMIAANVMADAILGANFLTDYEVVIDFREKSFTTRQNNEVARHSFIFDGIAREADGGERVSSPGKTVKDIYRLKAVDQDRSMTYASVQGISVRKPDRSEPRVGSQNNIKMEERAIYKGGMRIPANYDSECEELICEGQRTLFPTSLCLTTFSINRENENIVASGYYASGEADVGHREFQELGTNPNFEANDARIIPTSDLRLKVNEATSLDERQRKNYLTCLWNIRATFQRNLVRVTYSNTD